MFHCLLLFYGCQITVFCSFEGIIKKKTQECLFLLEKPVFFFEKKKLNEKTLLH